MRYNTLFLTNFTLFKDQPELTVQFSQANGLREGDSVLVAGVRWGRVKTMTFDPTAPNDRRITVTALLYDPLVLREGFEIRIEDATLLGGRNLTIDPGPPDAAPIETERMLFGTVAPNPLDAFSDLVRGSEGKVSDILDNVRDVTTSIRNGKGMIGRLVKDEVMAAELATSVSSASKLLANTEAITNDLRAGKGTIGQLLVQSELHDDLADALQKLSRVLDDAAAVSTQIRQGDGLVNRVIFDPEVANDVAMSLENVRAITGLIRDGQGTVGRLITDDTIATNLASLTAKLDDGQGTLGALFSRADLYENLLQASDDIAMITSQVREGKGSLGQLVMADDVYQQLRTALQIVQRSLEEFRESAPVTTFTSVFFGAF
jgi:phospholipid/cholesterol/gamma-HCH transport system substrate-binding protein